jgi:glyoxylase-like metal-dependent hydrolase (beta-lactamase superfamily II)
VKQGHKRILHAALAVAVLGALGAFSAMPRHGVCVNRNMMFWRTKIDATHLRDNIYMLRVYGTDLINANTVALIGEEGILLVDPGHPEMLRKERAALPRMRDSRVRMVIDSHGHPDHACANGELYRQGAIIVGHSSIRNYFETSKWAPPRSPGDTPQITYDRELTLSFDSEQVRLIHPPLAHTDGDTITVFKHANVIHTGDIFVMGAFPYMKDSSIDGYIFAQELLLKLSNDQTLIVPGHGPLARRSDVEKSLERMREVRRRISALISEGLTEEQVLARHPLDDIAPGGARAIQTGQAVAGYVYASLKKEAAKDVGGRTLAD